MTSSGGCFFLRLCARRQRGSGEVRFSRSQYRADPRQNHTYRVILKKKNEPGFQGALGLALNCFVPPNDLFSHRAFWLRALLFQSQF